MLTTCLQSRFGKTLNALFGVAYTENRLNSRSSIVPKLYRESRETKNVSRKILSHAIAFLARP
jgi:hypothetical protein